MSTMKFDSSASPPQYTSRMAVERRRSNKRYSASPSTAVEPARTVARSVGVMGLLGVGLIHLLDAPGKFGETRYVFWLYIALIISSLAVSAVLLHRDSRLAWAATGLLAGMTMVAFTVSRTTGLPAATGDIGNWSEPLGLASLLVEGCLVALSIYRLVVLERSQKVHGDA